MTVRAIVWLMLLMFTDIARAAPAEGEVPPAHVGFTRDGKPVLLTDYAGKAIVVSFWATWCPYCMKELPILHNIQKAAGKDRLQVIAVNTESRELFRRIARDLEALQVQVTHDREEESKQAFGVQGIPHMLIIGRDGRIIRICRGYNEGQLEGIAADINRALASPSSASLP